VSTEQITKRRVTMTSVRAIGRDDKGRPILAERSMTDYVPDDERGLLEPYLAAQRASGQWDTVEVSEDYDAGPAGYHGQTAVPVGFTRPTPEGQPDEWVTLEHELAGQVFEASEASKRSGGGDAAPGSGPTSFHGLDWVARRYGIQAQLQLGILTLGLAVLAIQTATLKNSMATYYGTQILGVDLTSTVPGGAAGTVLTGGSPAYARKAPAWGAPSNGVVSTGAMTFDVASGSTVAGFNEMSALAGGTYLDGNSLPSQTFASQGTYALTLTYTQG